MARQVLNYHNLSKATKKQLLTERKRGSVEVAERLRFMNGTQRHAVLSTVSNGQPYTSLVAFAMTPEMKRVVFATPRRTAKYRNILKNNRVALLIDTRSNTDTAYMESEAVTVIGTALPIRRSSKREFFANILMEKHPALKGFIQSKTTAIIVVEAEKCFHTGSFQEVSEWCIKKS